MEMVKSEKDTLNGEVRKKDDTLHYLQNKIREIEEEHLSNDQKNHDNVILLWTYFLRCLDCIMRSMISIYRRETRP
jgi:hypothetical protein